MPAALPQRYLVCQIESCGVSLVGRRAQTKYCSQECWRAAHPGYNRGWELKNPEKTRAMQKKGNLKKYGITPELFDAQLAAQGGRCALFAICGHVEPGGKGTWHVDHDHETGEFRGLLCHECNVARVGANTVESARAVLIYLERAQKPLLKAVGS